MSKNKMCQLCEYYTKEPINIGSEYMMNHTLEQLGEPPKDIYDSLFCFLINALKQKIENTDTMNPQAELDRSEQIQCPNRELLIRLVEEHFPDYLDIPNS